ncbi:MAG: tRNA pseudouridine(38-40) synthase TruA [Clostridiales Family XIII bacterium]|jgi:tRNA pseudouridine38-40 synthase|nr:tRNA pseudouridine(38-40) synthase TruA [Clostridiales Family XIII bacterium]
MRNVLLTIAYDGTGFSGWQRQPERRTVQGELERVLAHVTGTEILLNGTSRTDAGVHALGQRASFAGEYGIPAERIPVAVNNLLEDIRVLAAEEVPAAFHARFDATGKTYLYRIGISDGSAAPTMNGRVFRDLFLRNYFYWLQETPDVGKMEAAARFLTGTHDFAAFQAAGGTPRESTVRTVRDIVIIKEGNNIDIEITGDGFLYNMVRILVGTLVETGLGRRAPEDAARVLASGDRRNAGHTAPPQGLYLKEVFFA